MLKGFQLPPWRGRDLGCRRGWFVYVVCAICLLIPFGWSWAVEQISEYQVKAACLYNFTKFVAWPPTALGETNQPFVIGVVGRDPFEGQLERAVRDKTVLGHPIVVKHPRTASELHQCHLVFIPASEGRSQGSILGELRGVPILTVVETDGTAPGMIRFFMRDRKLRFEIDDGSAKAAGLRISSKLLSLAQRGNREESVE